MNVNGWMAVRGPLGVHLALSYLLCAAQTYSPSQGTEAQGGSCDLYKVT